ncbi:MAG: hypothetical protein ACQCN6_01535 [Candidatus Bathyarchaeia archaeon]
MSEADVFVRQEAALEAVRSLAVDVFGEPKKKLLACEDFATFTIDKCKSCPEAEKCDT